MEHFIRIICIFLIICGCIEISKCGAPPEITLITAYLLWQYIDKGIK